MHQLCPSASCPTLQRIGACSTRYSSLLRFIACRWINSSSKRGTVKERCYYEVLGVCKTATQAEIKRAFYERSKKLHPDNNESNSTSTAAFVELKTAYDTLKRPFDRRIYDHREEKGERYGRNSRSYHPYPRPDYYGGEGDWQSYWRKSNSQGTEGQKMSESEIFKRREEQWRVIMKWTIFGAAVVLLYNAGYVLQLRWREAQIARLIESDEIARCFLRQPEFKDKATSQEEMASLAAMLKKDVDAAYRRRSEELTWQKNPDEIREEYRWMRAVEDAGRYDRYREWKKKRLEKMRQSPSTDTDNS